MRNRLMAFGLAVAAVAATAQNAPDPEFSAKALAAKNELLAAQRISAQHCVLPAGSVGLGKFCQKKPAPVSVETIDALTAAYTAKTQSDSQNRTLLEESKKEAARLNGELSQTQIALAAAQAQIPKKPTAVATTASTANQNGAMQAAPATSSSPAAEDAREWTIEVNDITLANTFARWAKQAGWRVRWDANKHVYVDASDTITGTFPDAIRSVLEGAGIYNSRYPLEVCFYANTPPLARITLRGQQDKECKQ